jgi:hypothetical protein
MTHVSAQKHELSLDKILRGLSNITVLTLDFKRVFMVNIYLDIHYDFFRPKLKVASSFSPFRKLA